MLNLFSEILNPVTPFATILIDVDRLLRELFCVFAVTVRKSPLWIPSESQNNNSPRNVSIATNLSSRRTLAMTWEQLQLDKKYAIDNMQSHNIMETILDKAHLVATSSLLWF